jgi:GntR family transcriptional regulator
MSTAYNQLARSLRDNIISGKWPDGQKLPTERELCGRYGFSRITVRRALHALEEEHLVVRRQGLGTFVNVRPRKKIPIIKGDFTRSVLKHAPNIKRKVLEYKQRPAGDDLARQLGVPPGETIILVRRLDMLANHPTSMDEVTMPLRYADRLLKSDWETVDFIEQWRRRQGLILDYESQVIEAAPAEGALIKRLKVKRGYPLLMETNFIHLAGGQVAAKFISYYRYEYYQFNSVDRVIGGPARGNTR